MDHSSKLLSFWRQTNERTEIKTSPSHNIPACTRAAGLNETN